MLDGEAPWRSRAVILRMGSRQRIGDQRIQQRPFLPPENQLLASTDHGSLARVSGARLGRRQLSSHHTLKRCIPNQATSLILSPCRCTARYRRLSRENVSSLISSTLLLRNLGHYAYRTMNCKHERLSHEHGRKTPLQPEASPLAVVPSVLLGAFETSPGRFLIVAGAPGRCKCRIGLWTHRSDSLSCHKVA